MKSKKKSISINVIFNLIYQSLTVILPLITIPYLSRTVGSEAIGVNGYTLSIVTYFVLFGSLGTAMYGQREIAKVEDDKKQYTKVFWEIFIIRILFTALSMIIFGLLFCLNNQYSFYYRIFLIYMIAYSLNISWFFQGIELFDKIVLRNIIVKLLSIVVIFIFVKKPEDLWIYILIFSVSELLGNLSLWLYLPNYFVKIKIQSLQFKRHIIPTISLFLPQVAIQIYTVLDKTMVGLITKDMNEVGYYEQAQNIAKAVLVILSSVQIVMNSRVANASAKNNENEIKRCLKNSFSFVWMAGVPMMFGLIAVSGNLIPWYYGNDFSAVRPILIASSPLILAIGLNGITGIVYLIHTGQQKYFTRSVILGAIINVIFNLLLINKIGTIGAAISSVMAETAILIFHFKYIRRIYKIKNIFSISIKPIISGTVMFAVLMVISSYLSPSLLNTILLVFIGGIVYLILLFAFRYQLLIDIINKVIISLKIFLKR